MTEKGTAMETTKDTTERDDDATPEPSAKPRPRTPEEEFAVSAYDWWLLEQRSKPRQRFAKSSISRFP